jgi:hypothetical protein
MDDTPRRSHILVGATSLIVGPALMSVGDLLHPPESMDASAQVAIVAAAASRWYGAHLLLLVGMLLVVPGILTLTWLASERSQAAGHVARLLILASVGAFSAVFVFEMVLGRFLSDGAAMPSAVALLETFQSSRIFLVLVPGLLAFFIGTAFFVAPLAARGGPFRWPAVAFAVGAALILTEIVSANVLFSQIGNAIIFLASTAFAWLLLRDRRPTPRAGPRR